MSSPASAKQRRQRLKLAVVILLLVATGAMAYRHGDMWRGYARSLLDRTRDRPATPAITDKLVDRPPRATYPDQPVVAMLDFSVDRDGFPRERGAALLAEMVRMDMPTDRPWRWVDRSELRRHMDELALSLSRSPDDADALRVGDWLGCSLIVTGEFTDTGGPGQSLRIAVIDPLTADIVTHRELPFPEDPALLDRLPAERVTQLVTAIDEALRASHEQMVSDRGDSVVMLMYLANRTDDARLNDVRHALSARLADLSRRQPRVRVVRITHPGAATQEQGLSLSGMTDRPAEAWQFAADYYLWGELRPADEQDATPRALAPDEHALVLELNVWNGMDEPRVVTLHGTMEQIRGGLDTFCNRVWDTVSRPIPAKLNLSERDRLAGKLRQASGGYTINQHTADPDSSQTRQYLEHRQAEVAARFFTSTIHFHASIFTFLPFQADRQWLLRRRYIDRMHREFTQNRLGSTGRSDFEVRRVLDVMRALREALWIDNDWTRDMPRAERLAFQDNLLRKLRELGEAIERDADERTRESIRFMGIDDFYHLLLDEPTSAPRACLDAWHAWWPILEPDILAELSRPYSDRYHFWPQHEAALRRLYAQAGEPDGFDDLLATAMATRRTATPTVTIARDVDAARAWIAQATPQPRAPTPAAPQFPGVDHPPAPAPSRVVAPPIPLPKRWRIDAPVIQPDAVGLALPAVDTAVTFRIAQPLHDPNTLRASHGPRGGVLITGCRAAPPHNPWLRVTVGMDQRSLVLRSLDVPPDLKQSVADSLWIDGQLWHAVPGSGVHRLSASDGRWESLGVKQGLSSDRHARLTRVGNQVVISGGGRIANVAPLDRAPGESVTDLTLTGEILGAAGDRLLTLEPPNRWVLTDLRHPAAAPLVVTEPQERDWQVLDVTVDRDRAWALCRNGLVEYAFAADGTIARRTHHPAEFPGSTTGYLRADGPMLWIVIPRGKAWVGVWDTRQSRWRGQFEAAGKVTGAVLTDGKLILAAIDPFRDLAIVDCDTAYAAMGVTPPARER